MRSHYSFYVQTIGAAQVTAAGQNVLPLRTQKATALLFFLALEWSYFGRREHRREYLADLLWTELDRKAGLENLRQALYTIRRKLKATTGANFIHTDRKTVTKAANAEVQCDLLAIKQGNSFELLQLPPVAHVPLADLVLYDCEPFQEWLTNLQFEVQQASREALLQAMDREATLKKWGIVEQLAQLYLAQTEEPSPAVFKTLATACAQQGKAGAALSWLEKAGFSATNGQAWLRQFRAGQDFSERSNDETTRLAVLPFRLVNPPRRDDFSIGLLEDLISQLSHSPSLAVASSYSALQYQHVQKTLPEIALELNVDFILTGSIQYFSNRLKINLQLIEAQKDRILWSAALAREADDLFAVQQEVIARTQEGLRDRLGMREQPEQTHIPHPEAYAWYLQGWSAYWQGNPEGTHAAIRFFKKAIAADSDFHRAYLGLATALSTLASWWGDKKITDVLPTYETAIAKAAEDDSLRYDVSSKNGWVKMWLWDLEGAERHFRYAATTTSAISFTWAGLAHALNMQGKHREAIQAAQQGINKDPGNTTNFIILAEAHLLLGDFAKSEQICRAALRQKPDYHAGLTIHVWALIFLSKAAQAIELAEASLARTGRRTYFLVGRLAQAYLALGDRASAERLLAEMIARAKQGEKGFPYFIALYYQLTGESGKALNWLEHHLKDRLTDYLWLKVQPEFKPLHDDERFQRILKVVFG